MAASFTQTQLKCIKSVDSRLVISAGAGTGKTFTLTQKISHMLQTGSLESIDRVLAITFTRKAASEIKGRIRSTLRQQDMHEQALLVDGAWISTIHGMCLRILKEHALEFGLDPSLSIIEDSEANVLLEDCLENVLSNPRNPELKAAIDAVFLEYRAKSANSSQRGMSVKSTIEALVRASTSSTLGFDSIEVGPKPRRAKDVITFLLDTLSNSLSVCGQSSCTNSGFVKAMDARSTMFDKLSQVLNEDPSEIELLAAINDLPKIGRLRGSKYPLEKETMAKDVEAVGRACLELQGACSGGLLRQMILIAKEVKSRMDVACAQLGKISNDDLLVATLKALKSHPEVAQKYQQMFSLVLVDEFQDTSQIQIDIINELVGQNTQLCTIGDAQQSIYRFRGADVNVYEDYVQNSGASPVELGLNFRSHGDILAFSNAIFEQSGVFDRRFLRLEPGRKSPEGGYLGIPRIHIISTQSTSKGPKKADMRLYSADAMAAKFEDFRKAGAKASEMVLLLGAMTHAKVYMDALSARGFDVLIAGGSGFWKEPQAALVGSIAAALADPLDLNALYGVLDGGLLPIGDDDLATLAVKDGHCRDVAYELWQAAKNADESLALKLLSSLLAEGRSMLGSEPLYRIVEWILSDSGCLDYLESLGPEGLAAAANLLKAVRILAQIEKDGVTGPASIAREYSARMQLARSEAPGVLVSGGSEAIRIMTIHASKGLEFPIVALAEFDGFFRASSFTCQSLAGRSYVMLAPSRSTRELEEVRKYIHECENTHRPEKTEIRNSLKSSKSYADYSSSLKAFAKEEELAESRRKLYVGITRASEALIVLLPRVISKYGLSTGTVTYDIHSAFFESDELPSSSHSFNYGGGEPGIYERIMLEFDQNGKVFANDYPEPLALGVKVDRNAIPIPAHVPRALPDIRAWHPDFSEMFSYSSISGGHKDYLSEVETAIESTDESDPARSIAIGDSLLADEDSASELGLAFHAIAEYMAISGLIASGKVLLPDQNRIDAIAASFDISSVQKERLMSALTAWVQSDVAARASNFETILAELPFCISFSTDLSLLSESSEKALQGEGSTKGLQSSQNENSTCALLSEGPAKVRQTLQSLQQEYYLNGEIDLLCTNAQRSNAFVVDYKTGGSDAETAEQLIEKHKLQSLCYAYAVLSSGFFEVELAFVRVERIGFDGQPQVVSYKYSKDDFSSIKEQISLALSASRERGA